MLAFNKRTHRQHKNKKISKTVKNNQKIQETIKNKSEQTKTMKQKQTVLCVLFESLSAASALRGVLSRALGGTGGTGGNGNGGQSTANEAFKTALMRGFLLSF